jgi:hypothetical protein
VGSELQSLFTSRGEMLTVQDDAAIQPERFVPGCRLTFTLVTRANAAFRNVFGWYNVRPGVVPTPTTAPRDLHVLIPCDAQAGQAFTLDLRNNPDYAGGEIGFFLRTPEDGTTGRCTGDCCASLSRTGHTYYSERGYNPDAMGADSYIHLLIYDSRARSRAFYFAWEDLYGGGDNNFTDFVASVDQIVCTGAGAACDTGRPGACAQGSLQCRNGALACLGAVTPQAERCDGIDNDCNGMVDEGDGLCGARMVCDRGVCVDRCMGELGCFEGFVCSERGTCVEAACATVSCAAGQRCAAGACVGACDALSCPRGRHVAPVAASIRARARPATAIRCASRATACRAASAPAAPRDSAAAATVAASPRPARRCPARRGRCARRASAATPARVRAAPRASAARWAGACPRPPPTVAYATAPSRWASSTSAPTSASTRAWTRASMRVSGSPSRPTIAAAVRVAPRAPREGAVRALAPSGLHSGSSRPLGAAGEAHRAQRRRAESQSARRT